MPVLFTPTLLLIPKHNIACNTPVVGEQLVTHYILGVEKVIKSDKKFNRNGYATTQASEREKG
jgi:hypothetical protein